jgi:hypothetical protein
MNTVEDLLREGMERFTRDLRAPAGLTRRAARRHRRRLALRSAAGVVAALTAAAVALVLVVVPGARDDSAAATAYVVKRVDGALSAAEPGEIAQVTVTTRTAMPDGTTTTTSGEEWSYSDQWRSIANKPSGRPVYDEGFSAASLYTLVSYQTRTWARQREPGPAVAPSPTPGSPVPWPSGRPTFSGLSGPPASSAPGWPVPGPGSCEPVVAALPLLFFPGLPRIYLSAKGEGSASSPAAVARALRAAISCGTLAVAGRQRVDGIEAIELTSPPDKPSVTIWVSPGTYLPVRVVVRSAFHHAFFVGGQTILQLTADITWLRPTAQNLAKLTVPIPAGFRHVPLDKAVGPILQQIPGGLPKGVSGTGQPGLPGAGWYVKPRCRCSLVPTSPSPSG